MGLRWKKRIEKRPKRERERERERSDESHFDTSRCIIFIECVVFFLAKFKIGRIHKFQFSTNYATLHSMWWLNEYILSSFCLNSLAQKLQFIFFHHFSYKRSVFSYSNCHHFESEMISTYFINNVRPICEFFSASKNSNQTFYSKWKNVYSFDLLLFIFCIHDFIHFIRLYW